MSNAGLFDFKPHHAGISVPDLEASIGWYHDILGFEVEERFEVKQVPFKAAMLKRGDFRIELFEVQGAAPLPPSRRIVHEDLKTHGTKHVAFRVPDVRGVFSTLKAHGVDIAWDVFEMDGHVAGFIRDNSGNLIEFVQQA